jgi:hypothetical protein
MLLKQGSKGKEVTSLQSYLDYIGYKIKATGYFDFITFLCVKDFQRHVFPGQPKECDGIVGNKTRDMIKKYNSHNYCPEVFEEVLGIEDNTDAQLEKAMRYGFVGLGSTFNQICKKNNYKWSHAVARGALESAWGTSKIAHAKSNIFGYMSYDSSPFASSKKFKSFEACIEFWIPWMIRKYLSPKGKYYNGNSEYGINKKYSTSPIAGISVGFLVRSIRQDANK